MDRISLSIIGGIDQALTPVPLSRSGRGENGERDQRRVWMTGKRPDRCNGCDVSRPGPLDRVDR